MKILNTIRDVATVISRDVKYARQERFINRHVHLPNVSDLPENIKNDLYYSRLTLARHAAANDVFIDITENNAVSRGSNIIVRVVKRGCIPYQQEINTLAPSFPYEHRSAKQVFHPGLNKFITQLRTSNGNEAFLPHLYRVVSSLTEAVTGK